MSGKPSANVTSIRGDRTGKPAFEKPVTWLNELKRERNPGPNFGSHRPEFTGLSTLAVQAGSTDDPLTGAVGTPIYQATTFLLDQEQYRSFDQGYARDRFIYSRYGNPSQWAVQEKLAALENAESALVFSSGMAAITAAVLALMDKGAHAVVSNELYGGTYNLFNSEFPSLGMSTTSVDPRDLDAIEAAIQPHTQILYFETITNPLLKVMNLPAIADIAERHNVRVIVDATFSTPIVTRALDMGIDIVVHSATKYLNGHSDLTAGVAAGSRKLIDQVWGRLLTFGGCLDPHACFLLERGLKTLAIRMKAHAEGAMAVSQYLENHPKIERVLYPMLPSHPDHALAKEILKQGTGNVTFFVKGGNKAALSLLDTLSIPRQATSLGGVESLISMPFNSSHSGYTARQLSDLGIHPGCVRLSVGIEDADDLIADFERALSQISA